MDNASANDVLAEYVSRLLLKRYGVQFSPENGRIRCIAHVINLIVQKILSTLSAADDPAVVDYYDLYNKHLPAHLDINELDEDLEAADATDGAAAKERKKPGKTGIKKDVEDDGLEELLAELEMEGMGKDAPPVMGVGKEVDALNKVGWLRVFRRL